MTRSKDADATLELDPSGQLEFRGARAVEMWGLVIAWCRDAPSRLGEVAFVRGPTSLGRGDGAASSDLARAQFLRQRPGEEQAAPPLSAPRLSRCQLVLSPEGDRLRFDNRGKCELRLGDQPAVSGTVGAGDTLYLDGELLLLVVRRPRHMHRPASEVSRFEFGAADPHGLIGEAPATWALRERLAFAARAGAHVLLLGGSGVGKELCAKAIHALSSRKGVGPFVARNAATLPPGLVDAELFGNVRNYPNPGMAERPGLIGAADKGTLFLDELGELPLPAQAHLLRVLDAGGEYQRLGDTSARRAELCVVAATNRNRDELKHDLAARFAMIIEVPPLEERREDIPLLLRALLRDTSDRLDASVPRIDPQLVDALLRARYHTGVRQIERALLTALSSSRPGRAALTPEVRAELAASSSTSPAQPSGTEPPDAPTPPSELGREELVAALEAAEGSVTRAARALGLSSRYALYRLLKKHSITP